MSTMDQWCICTFTSKNLMHSGELVGQSEPFCCAGSEAKSHFTHLWTLLKMWHSIRVICTTLLLCNLSPGYIYFVQELITGIGKCEHEFLITFVSKSANRFCKPEEQERSWRCHTIALGIMWWTAWNIRLIVWHRSSVFIQLKFRRAPQSKNRITLFASTNCRKTFLGARQKKIIQFILFFFLLFLHLIILKNIVTINILNNLCHM